MARILWLCIPALLLLTACSDSGPIGYTKASEGYYYKLLAIGDGKHYADSTSSVLCTVALRTQHDSLFFNSNYTGLGLFRITLNAGRNASGKAHFLKLAEGDSLSLMIGKTICFRDYFDTLVPYFLSKDSMVKLDVRIITIMKTDTHNVSIGYLANSQTEDKELLELKGIDDYLKKNYPGVSADANGIYVLEHQHTTLEKASPGKKVRVSYRGFYLNGNPVESGSQQLEFTLGTPDQLVKGLNIVIQTLKKGETTKIIVPSRLAFGESGSTNGSIPPYTPLLYNLTLIDIK